MTDEQPEQWAVELLDAILTIWGTLGDRSAALAIQRAFTERTAELVADNAKLREALSAIRKLVAGGPKPNTLAVIARVDLVATQALAQQDNPDAK